MATIQVPRAMYTYFETTVKRYIAGEGWKPVKSVDPLFFQANNNLNKMMTVYSRTVFGSECSHSGSSAIEARLVTPSGQLDAAHKVDINDGGSHVWRVSMNADDDLRFDDGDLIVGSSVADYSVITPSTLTIQVVGDTTYLPYTTVAQVLTGSNASAFNGDDLPYSNTDAVKIQAGLQALETSYKNIVDWNDTTHSETTAGLLDSTVKNATLDPEEVFITESFGSEIYNGNMEVWGSGPKQVPSGWALNSATVEQESTIVFQGDYSAKVTALFAGQGFYYSIPNYSDFDNLPFNVVARVYVASGTVDMTVDDGSSVTTTTTVTTGSWETLHLTKSLSGISNLEINFQASGAAAVWYVDSVVPSTGVIGKFSQTSAKHVDVKYSGNLKNWMIPEASTFSSWTSTSISTFAPHGWASDVGIGTIQYTPDTTNAVSGSYACKITTATANKYMVCSIGDLTDVLTLLKGEDITISMYIMRGGATIAQDWEIIIDDGVGTTPLAVTSGNFLVMTPVSINHTVSGSATKLDVRIKRSNTSGNDDIYIDNVWINLGNVPSRATRDGAYPSIWVADTFDFRLAGAISDNTILEDQLDIIIPDNSYLFSVAATMATAPSAGTVSQTEFIVLKHDQSDVCAVGDTTTLDCNINIANKKGTNFIDYSEMETDQAALSDSINVKLDYDVTIGTTDGEDASVRVKTYTMI